MRGNYGVIAEGWIEGNWVTSLGKAGVDKHGELKPNACYSLESALYRALKCCANKFRASKDGIKGWIEFPNLPEGIQNLLILEISKLVNLEMVEPGLYRTTLEGTIFQTSLNKVWA